MKELKFYNKARDGNRKICGTMTIKNPTDSSADLFFYGDIVSETWQSECYEEDMAPGDVKEFLDQLDGTENINIHINSGGGSVFGGIAIYNMLRHNNAHKTVYIDGLAASIASVIMMAGDEIVMHKNATVMIHKPSASYFFTTKNAIRCKGRRSKRCSRMCWKFHVFLLQKCSNEFDCKGEKCTKRKRAKTFKQTGYKRNF